MMDDDNLSCGDQSSIGALSDDNMSLSSFQKRRNASLKERRNALNSREYEHYDSNENDAEDSEDDEDDDDDSCNFKTELDQNSYKETLQRTPPRLM